MTDTSDKTQLNDVAAYIKEHAIREADADGKLGDRTLTKSKYYGLHDQVFANPRKAVDSVHDGDSTIFGAAINVAAEDLVVDIARAKDAGDSPDELVSSVNVKLPHGTARVNVSAVTHPRDLRTGDVLTKYGSSTVRVVIDKGVKRGPASEAAELIRKAIEG